MTNAEIELNNKIDDADVDLSKALMALQELTDSYDWNIKPSPEKASKYKSSRDISKCSKDEEISYRLLMEYDRIMWLIHVTQDYCFNASQALKRTEKQKDREIMEHTEAHEKIALIEVIKSNLEKLDIHFLKCVLAFTNKLAE